MESKTQSEKKYLIYSVFQHGKGVDMARKDVSNRQLANSCGVPEATVQRKLKQQKQCFRGKSTILTAEEEISIIDWIRFEFRQRQKIYKGFRRSIRIRTSMPNQERHATSPQSSSSEEMEISFKAFSLPKITPKSPTMSEGVLGYLLSLQARNIKQKSKRKSSRRNRSEQKRKRPEMTKSLQH